MEHIAALLLIVGCSADYNSCRELPSPVTVYETSMECDADLPDALRRLGAETPRVLGVCVAVDPAMEEEDAELVWDVNAQGKLGASIEAGNLHIAAINEE
jgi:hypothetical protein